MLGMKRKNATDKKKKNYKTNVNPMEYRVSF